MKGMNKVIRLDAVCTPLATEVVSFDIRSKIRYDATTAGIPVETRCIASLQRQQIPLRGGKWRKTNKSDDRLKNHQTASQFQSVEIRYLIYGRQSVDFPLSTESVYIC